MRPAMLLLKAVVALSGPLGEEATLTLVLNRQAKGDRMRFLGRAGGPLCEVLCARDDGTTVAAPARQLADWLAKNRIAWMRRDGEALFACDAEGEIEIICAEG